MAFRLQNGRAYAGGNDLLGGLPLLREAEVAFRDDVDGLDLAEPDALGIPVAQVAFGHFAFNAVEVHGTEGAHRHAGAAPDTNGVVDFNPAHLNISGYGLGRTGVQAGGVFALLARHGDIDPIGLPFDHLDAAAHRVRHAVMMNRTDQLTESASGALFVIYL